MHFAAYSRPKGFEQWKKKIVPQFFSGNSVGRVVCEIPNQVGDDGGIGSGMTVNDPCVLS